MTTCEWCKRQGKNLATHSHLIKLTMEALDPPGQTLFWVSTWLCNSCSLRLVDQVEKTISNVKAELSP